MKKIIKKCISFLTVAAMIFAMLPAISAPAYAGMAAFDIGQSSITIAPGTDSGTLKITYLGVTEDNRPNAVPVTGSTTVNKIIVESGVTANITLDDVEIDLSGTDNACALEIKNDTAVNLTLSGENTLKSGANQAGILVPGAYTWGGPVYDEAELTIDGDGTLNVYGGTEAAGIGGVKSNTDSKGPVGSITINGGIINAYGGAGSADGFHSGAGAGIGGAYGSGNGIAGSGGTIVITDGTVNATGGSGSTNKRGGPGIGSDRDVAISITGGTVSAIGAGGPSGTGGGAGIGGRVNTDISITGGTVTAIGGYGAYPHSAIGYSGSGSLELSGITLTISSAATVRAYSYTMSARNDSSGTPAIAVSSGTLEAGSTAAVFMATFNQPVGAGKLLEVRNTSGALVTGITTQFSSCRSVALTLPSSAAATYSLYVNKDFYNNGYWGRDYDNSTDASDPAFPVAGAGISAFYAVGFYGPSLPVSGLSAGAGSVSYNPDGGPVTVDSSLSLNSFNDDIETATVLVRNFKTGDVLEYPTQIGNITGSFNSDNGVLTLSGSDTQANYQSALRSVNFYTVSDDTTARIIDFAIGSAMYCGDTGHFYEYVPVPGRLTWLEAKTAAELRTLYGRTGYLISITSAAENDFIQGKVMGEGWIGAKDIDPDLGIADWRWVTGPEGLEDSGNGLSFWSGFSPGSVVGDSFTNWGTNQPDNYLLEYPSLGETVGQMIVSPTDFGRWNDLSTSNRIVGYFVEYGGLPSDNPLTLSSSKTITIMTPGPAGPGDTGGGSGGGGKSPAPAQTGAPVIVNGTSYTAGTAADSTSNGKTVTTVTVETEKLKSILDSQRDKPAVIIPVTSGSEVAAGILTGQMVSDMEGRGATLSLRTNSVSYTLPAEEININAISQQFGSNVTLSDVAVKIEIAEPSDNTVKAVVRAAESGDFEIVIPAIEFSITCTYQGQTVNAKVFNTYVERTILIPDGVDPDGITTGVVIRPDGTSYHVPTQVTVIGGKYYAVIKSLTNSTYTVIWNPREFTDVAGHWAKEAVNDMGSRMVVSGVGDDFYEPDRNITRAEFAAIVVRALGLDTGMGENDFSDVKSSSWFSGYIETAVGYGIINGYGSGSFGPNDQITREQAMTMIARAMKLTGLEPKLSDAEKANLLAAYSDSEQSSAFATDGIAKCLHAGVVTGRSGGTIAPAAYITRAEVAAIVQRLLQKSELI